MRAIILAVLACFATATVFAGALAQTSGGGKPPALQDDRSVPGLESDAAEEARLKAQGAEAREPFENDRSRLAAAKMEERRAALQREHVAQAVANTNCQSGGDVDIDTLTDEAGRLTLNVAAPCHGNEAFTIKYGHYAFEGELNGSGHGQYVLDLFLGTKEQIVVSLQGGAKKSIPAPQIDMSGLSKVALVWRPNVNLDLHALEYLAQPGSPGHVWAGIPSSLADAREAVARTNKGHGFISTSSQGSSNGDKVEIYTFVHDPKQHSGIVSLFVDYQTRAKDKRPDTCGEGPNARMHFEIVRLLKGKTIKREKILIAPLNCDADLGGKSRYLRYGIRDLRVR